MSNRAEPKWVHPVSGETCRRQSLGTCRTGRLVVKRCGETGGVNLYWFANGGLAAATDPFDGALRQLMPEDEPVPLSHGLQWLCCLPPADYRLEDRAGGGMALFRLHWQSQAKHPPAGRRHTVVTGKGNQVVKLR